MKEEIKVVAYVASKLMGSVEVLAKDNNMVVIKVDGIRVAGIYWQPEWSSEETENQLEWLERRLGGVGRRIIIGD